MRNASFLAAAFGIALFLSACILVSCLMPYVLNL